MCATLHFPLAASLLLAGSAALADENALPDPLEAGWKGKPVCEGLRDDALLRVARCTFPPGVGHERHFHAPHFGYVLEGGRMRIVDANGTREVDLRTGYSWNSDGVPWHEALNIGDTVSSYLIVEPKTAAQAKLNTEDDHQRLLDLLGIDALRRGADGDPNSEFAANYDERYANANLNSLPELLRLNDGSAVTSATAWRDQRRPELIEKFEREVYGRVPDDLPPVEWAIDAPVRDVVAGIPVMRQQVTGVVRPLGAPSFESTVESRIPLEITWPADANNVPVVLELGFGPEFMAQLRERFTDEQLAAMSGGGPPAIEQVLARGWAYIKLDSTAVQADNGAGLNDGIIGVGNHGQPRDLDDWGALRAWGWAASRVLEYLGQRSEFDAQRMAVYGHSRFGKAALVAMAFDERIAAGFISSSGEGGAKLWRRHFGEQVGNIAGTGEYHWVAGNFLKYAGPLGVADLPVDAHALIALCAPRPVFISSGDDGDQWTDPKGMFLAAAAAGPVYELLGKQGVGTGTMPDIGTGLTAGELAWRQHELGHTPGPNWSYFLDFAARYFESP